MFFGIFVYGPLQSFVVNVCTLVRCSAKGTSSVIVNFAYGSRHKAID